MQRLQHKVALVTGAAHGDGAAIAAAFVREGARVVVTDIDEAAGRATARRLGASWMRLDVRDELAWISALARVLDSHGRLDVLVNSAAITGFEIRSAGDLPRPHDPEHAALADWQAVHRTNLDGVFLGCKHAIGAMRRNGGGSIVNLSSRAAPASIAAAAACASSQAAVRYHTRSVARYCESQRLAIRCNAIHPAAILAPRRAPMRGDRPRRTAGLTPPRADAPVRRFDTPEEVAALAVLLVSDDAPDLNGAEVHIDGGLLAGSVASPQEA